MTTFESKLASLLEYLDEKWEYDPYPSEPGVTIYIGFANKMAYMTACGILNKNLEPSRWTLDAENDGRIAMHIPNAPLQDGVPARIPPLSKLRHLMSAIGYEEGREWWVETT